MTQPEPALGTRRTTWASAAELQQAADTLRACAPDIEGSLGALAHPVADWLDETANALAWLAPFREHEPGHRMWQTATKVARTILGSTDLLEQQPTPAEHCTHSVHTHRAHHQQPVTGCPWCAEDADEPQTVDPGEYL